MNQIVAFPAKKCVECGALAPKELPLVSETGEAFSKFYCDKHLPRPLDEDGLRLLIDIRDAEIERLWAALEAELKFWRNQPSPYRHDERIAAIEAALGIQQSASTEKP